MKIITSNPGKYEEYHKFFEKMGLPIEWIRMKYPELQADTTEEVVIESLNYLISKGYRDFIVDDSGIFIDALNGFPGVYSSYVYKTLGLGGILKLLDGEKNRGAKFVTVIGLELEGNTHLFVGEVRGTINFKPQGENGFGYDPIFIPEGHSRTFAEMSIEEKNSISHRGRAMNKLKEFLIKKMI